MIPTEALFGEGTRVVPGLSPDGQFVSYVSNVNDVRNVWVRSVARGDDRPVTNSTERAIWLYKWTYSEGKLLFRHDEAGEEDWILWIADVLSGQCTRVSPLREKGAAGSQARILALSPDCPTKAVIGLNARDPRLHDAYLLDLESGRLTLLAEAPDDVLFMYLPSVYGGWLIDHSLAIRGYLAARPGGGSALMIGDPAAGYREVLAWDPEDALWSGPIQFAKDNRRLYIMDSTGRETVALVELDIASGVRRVLAADPSYDLFYRPSFNPRTGMPDCVPILRDRLDWMAIDDAVRPDLDYLRANIAGDFELSDRSLDDLTWLIMTHADVTPFSLSIYHRADKRLEPLFALEEDLVGYRFASTQSVSITTRDGITLHGFLTLPQHGQSPFPLVLWVHYGPWYHDRWHFDHGAQWLADRGCACLRVNYRGSSGYGKSFLRAGNREWGGKIQNDLDDALDWAVMRGVADPQRIAIMGGSFGGYCVLWALEFSPDVYRAGVMLWPVSDLLTFLADCAPYLESHRARYELVLGRLPRYADGPRQGQLKDEADWTHEDRADIEFLRSRSPIYFTDRVKSPLFIAHGANDARVHCEENARLVAALQARHVPVEYVVYPDEGHYLTKQSNALDFYRRAERFLAEHLGAPQPA